MILRSAQKIWEDRGREAGSRWAAELNVVGKKHKLAGLCEPGDGDGHLATRSSEDIPGTWVT